MVTQGDNDKAIVFDGVDHAVALRDPAGPEACEVMLERFGLADSGKRSARGWNGGSYS